MDDFAKSLQKALWRKIEKKMKIQPPFNTIFYNSHVQTKSVLDHKSLYYIFLLSPDQTGAHLSYILQRF